MPTLASAQTVTFGVQGDQTITLSTSPGTEGTLSWNAPNGVQVQTIGPMAAVNQVIRMNGVSGAATLVSKSGAITYTLSASQLPTVSTDPLTGGNTIVAGGSTLKLPAGESSLSGILPAVSGASAFRQASGEFTYGNGANFTHVSQIPFEKPYYAVRLVFANYSTTNVCSWNTIKVAPSPRSLSLENGTGLTWTQLTVNGSNSFTVPVATGSGGNLQPGIVVSDLISVTSVARTDIVGGLPLLAVRGFSSTDCRVGILGSTDAGSTGWIQSKGYEYLGTFAAGDLVTTTSAMFPSASASSIAQGAMFYSGDGTYDCFCFGDSLLGGRSGSAAANQSGWISQSSYLLRARSKVQSFFNLGLGGQTHPVSIATMKAFVTAYKPTSVLFYNFSPNSFSGSQANLDISFAATVDAVRWCKQQGVTPIVVCGTPVNSVATTQLANHTSRTKAALAGVCKVLDFYNLLCDPANPSQINPLYNYDGIHINNLGDAVAAQYVVDQLAV